MIQELAEKVWNNHDFRDAAYELELLWLKHEVGVDLEKEQVAALVTQLMSAAAILACSRILEHRRSAYRIATSGYELFPESQELYSSALRVVLSRLGNFPSISTREPVEASLKSLPVALALEEIARSDASRVVIDNSEEILFTDFQSQLWTHLAKRERVALSAPTSAGKTFVLQNYIRSLFVEPRDLLAVYIVPTRALISQVSKDLEAQFKRLDSPPEIISVPLDVDSVVPSRAVLVMTQERVQISMANHPELTGQLVVVDEAHSIAEGGRGVLLHWVIEDLLERQPDAQLLFASPTVKNLGVFERAFGLAQVKCLDSAEPTVEQNFFNIKIKNASRGVIKIFSSKPSSDESSLIGERRLEATIASKREKLVHIPFMLGGRSTNIVYANGPGEAEQIAMQLSELREGFVATERQKQLAELARESVHQNFLLAECVLHGVAFHYSFIPTQLRFEIEAAASEGEIDFLVCTSTLLQGVNLPAKNIFMCRPERGRGHPLESADFWNLSGRAGRLRREFQGNIFLIDYDKWDEHPLSGPREVEVEPAIEKCVRDQTQELVYLIKGASTGPTEKIDLEAAFVKLFNDFKSGNIDRFLQRFDSALPQSDASQIISALIEADESVEVPPEVLRKSPSVSAHKQQSLFEFFLQAIDADEENADKLIPLHPREDDAFNSYSKILKLCHALLLGRDTTRGLHRFHALLAMRWVRGLPLPQIISQQIERKPNDNTRTIIRDTLQTIEQTIRFEVVRLFGCYSAVLSHALEVSGKMDRLGNIPSMPIFLELGASDKTMISFMSLGLSRVAAMKLNDFAARKDMTVDQASEWLQTQPLNDLGFSPLLLREINEILNN